jgi:hypothetical protein
MNHADGGVKRFDYGGEYDVLIVEKSDGDYVLYTDYTQLEQQVEGEREIALRLTDDKARLMQQVEQLQRWLAEANDYKAEAQKWLMTEPNDAAMLETRRLYHDMRRRLKQAEHRAEQAEARMKELETEVPR